MRLNGPKRANNRSGREKPAGNQPGGLHSLKVVLSLILIVVVFGVCGAAASVTALDIQEGSPAGDVALRQAYLSWLAAQQEAGMDATIRFIAERNGSVEKLSSLREEFHRGSAGIPACSSMESLNTSLGTFRQITRQFQTEIRVQVAAGSLTEDDLAAAVSAAVDGDFRSRSLEDEYWMTRMDSEPAAFDRYIRESGETLFALRGYGYDVAPAQEKLDTIETMRREFVAALASHDFGTAETIREKIEAEATGFEDCIREIRVSGER